MIFWIVGGAVAVIAGAAYASRRGWIYLGFRKRQSSVSGVFGELIDAFHPSHSYVAEEMRREHLVFEESAPRSTASGPTRSPASTPELPGNAGLTYRAHTQVGKADDN